MIPGRPRRCVVLLAALLSAAALAAIAWAVPQIAAVDSIGGPATNDGLEQFEVRRSYCQQRSTLGLRNEDWPPACTPPSQAPTHSSTVALNG